MLCHLPPSLLLPLDLPPPVPLLTVDLLIQGVYARMMVAQPETGADLVTAVWVFIMFGTIGGAGLVAIFADKDPSLFFWVSLPFAAQILVPIAVGWLPEDPAVAGVRAAKWQANKKYFGLAVLMSAGALGLGAASLWGSAVVQAAYSITVSVVLCAASLWLLPPLIGTYRGSGGGGLSVRGVMDGGNGDLGDG